MALHSYNPPTDDTPDSADESILNNSEAAADVIREKLARIYDTEPSATEEIAEVVEKPKLTKHQQFMYDLSTSGKDLATVQTEWHDYYQSLPADEKHQVWHEFYSSQSTLATAPQSQSSEDAHAFAEHKQQAANSQRAKETAIVSKPRKLRDARSASDVQAAIRDTVTAGGKLQAKHHLQSLLFGLAMGVVVIVIFLFSFFNEVIIAPFIQPSRVQAATPLIVSSNSVSATAQPEVIIPKINVEIPVNYGETSTDESTIENSLESGIVHYPTTVLPGEKGNAAFFGHSSNNIFNKGKYKFAFVLLHTLVPGDTFYLTNNGKVYVYKVITKTVVPPSQVSVLGPVSGQTATATLITCDPPGTSLNRLVIVGQQISPDPSGNTEAAASTATVSNAAAGKLPGNGPTLWGRMMKTTLGKVGVGIVVIGAFLFVIRSLNKRFQRH